MPVAMADVLGGIKAYLADASDFTTSIGGRLRWDDANPNEVFPYAVMYVVSTTNIDTLQADGYSLRLGFRIYTTRQAGPLACRTIADQLIARFHRAGQTVIVMNDHEYMKPSVELDLGPTIEDQTWRCDLEFVVEGYAT